MTIHADQTNQTNQTAQADQTEDALLKDKHRTMWASGDYPLMVDTFLTPLGPRLVEACAIGAGHRVLDVAAGTGNVAIPAAQRGAAVTASDLTPELLEAGARRPEAAGLDLAWVRADAEDLPFDDASYDVVTSAIGVMFAPHHQVAADELLRVCRPGGTVGLLSWTPGGAIGSLFATMRPFAPPPPAGASSPPLWGSEEHLDVLLGDRVDQRVEQTGTLEVTAFADPRDLGGHFRAHYGPTIAVRAHAERQGVLAHLDAALDDFWARWDVGTPGAARFELEYRLTVGTRR